MIGYKNKFVVALGGSVAFPEKIDTNFLSRFCSFIKERVKKGDKFVIVVGGGKTARAYQEACSKIKKISFAEKDWIGIFATKLNAYFLKAIFEKIANSSLFDKRFKIKKFNERPVIIASGWEPGWSTDFVAVQIACDLKIKDVIVLGKPSYVYTSDFEKDKNAKPIEAMRWDEFLKIIPSKWTSGMKVPVDPVAARLAKKEKIKVIVANGRNLPNFRKILENKKFRGTILS